MLRQLSLAVEPLLRSGADALTLCSLRHLHDLARPTLASGLHTTVAAAHGGPKDPNAPTCAAALRYPSLGSPRVSQISRERARRRRHTSQHALAPVGLGQPRRCGGSARKARPLCLLRGSLCARARNTAYSRRIKVTFLDRDGSRHEVRAAIGQNMLEVAHSNDIDLEGACEGSLACSTCHVIVEGDAFSLIPEADDDENDMLDLAFGLTET